MSIKEFLEKGFLLKESIKTHRDEINELREMYDCVSGISYTQELKNPNMNTSATFTDVVNNIMIQEEELVKEIDTYIKLRMQLKNIINLVSCDKTKIILTKIYINNLTQKEISIDMNISLRTVARRVKEGIVEIENKVDTNELCQMNIAI